MGGLALRYDVHARGVNEVPRICGGLWDNLKRFTDCTASRPSCGNDSDSHVSVGLRWSFDVPIGCNRGMIESTWWEATRHDWGSISCVRV